jgi:hypothetical protein
MSLSEPRNGLSGERLPHFKIALNPERCCLSAACNDRMVQFS